MAPILAPEQIVQAFRDAGLNVVEMPGWMDRCRCHDGAHRTDPKKVRSFGPINGITIHHTAGPMLSGDQAIQYTRDILIAGNGNTPGPLCLAGVDADGRMIMVGAGRCNHIGSVSQASINAMQSASFSMINSQNLRGSGVDGNTHTYGFEALAPGAPNAAQVNAMVTAAAALCRLYGWDGGEVHGHGECSNQRDFSDPGLNMGEFRTNVRSLLTIPGGGGGQHIPTPAPQPTPQPTPQPPSSGWDGSSFPGASVFFIGSNHPAVTKLGQMLIDWGSTKYKVGAGIPMTETDIEAVREFQSAQGWTGADADGIPGSTSWNLLMTGTGKKLKAPQPEPQKMQLSVSQLRDCFYAHPNGPSSWTHPMVGPLQDMLVATGYLTGIQTRDHYGTSVVTAVKALQRALGDNPDGWLGPKQLNWLVSNTGNEGNFSVVN